MFNSARYDADGRVRYQTLVRGIYFRIAVGGGAEQIRELCSVHSLDQKIIVGD